MMKKLVLFLSIFCGISALLTYGFLHVMDASQLMKSDRILNQQKTGFTVIAGNSHTLALQPSVFKNSINIASYGEALHNTYFKLKFLVERGSKPRQIILSFDLGALSRPGIDHQNYQYYWNQYEDPWELLQFSGNKIDFVFTRLTSWAFPYLDGEVEVFDYFFSKPAEGELENLRDKNATVYPAMKRVLTDSCLQAQISPIGEYYLKKIIELCNETGTNLFLIHFPVTKAYYLGQSLCFDPQKYKQQVIERFGLEEPGKIMFIDLHDLYDDSFFYDPHHLKGGQVRTDFSKLLHQKIFTGNGLKNDGQGTF